MSISDRIFYTRPINNSVKGNHEEFTMSLREEETYLDRPVVVLTVQGIAAILFGIAAVFWLGSRRAVYLPIWAVPRLCRCCHVLGGLFDQQAWYLFSCVLPGIVPVRNRYLLRHPATSFALLIIPTGSSLVALGVVDVVVALSRSGTFGNEPSLVNIGGVAAAAGTAVFPTGFRRAWHLCG